MGYESNVRMVVRGPKEVILREFAALRLNGDDIKKEALDEWKVMDDDPITFMATPTDTKLTHMDAAVAILGAGGTHWKWHKAYPDVQAHTHIYQHFEELYSECEPDSPEAFLCGAFVRIGENDDDIESEDFGEEGYELARPVRTIDCHYDKLNSPDLRPRLAPTGA